MPAQVRAIVFDLDGTLLTFEVEYETLIRQVFREATGRVTDEWVERYFDAFRTAFGALEPDPIRSGFASVDGDLDADRLRDSLLAAELEHARPTPGAREDLERLGEAFTLGVLTNGVPEWQRAKLEAIELEAHFDAFVSSYEVGAHKPDPAPFRETEARLGAEIYAMVGDSASDVDGATNVGWSAHRYEGDGFGDLPAAFGWDSDNSRSY